MSRPFPYPVRVGTDICQIPRIYEILTKNGSKAAHRFLGRIFTPEERVWYRPRLEPLIQYLAQVEHAEFVQLKKAKQEQGRLNNVQFADGNAKPGEGDLGNGGSSAPGVMQGLREKSTSSNPSRIVRELEHEAMLEEMRQNVRGVASFIAGRFAAKEATTKAHIHRRLTYHDIIINSPVLKGMATQAPTVTIRAEKDGEEDQEVPVSISHDGDFATAVCIASETPSSDRPPVNSSIEAKTGTGSDHAGLESRRQPTESSYGVDPSVVIRKVKERPGSLHLSHNALENSPDDAPSLPIEPETGLSIETRITRHQAQLSSMTRLKDSPAIEVTTKSSIRTLTEEQQYFKQARATKLAVREQSIYRLPDTVDSKVIRKNVESCLKVYGFDRWTKIEDVIDAVDTLPVKYSAIKGYIQWEYTEYQTRGTAFLIMSNKNEARKSSREGPVLNGRRLNVQLAEPAAQFILREMGDLWRKGKLTTGDFGIEGPNIKVPRSEPKKKKKHIVQSKANYLEEPLEEKVRATTPGFKEGEFWTTDVWHVQEGALTKYAHRNYFTKASSKSDAPTEEAEQEQVKKSATGLDT